MDQHALTWAQPALSDEGVMRGQKRLGHRRGLLEVKAGWNGYDHTFVRDQELGLAAPGHDAHHAITDLERSGHVGPEGVDLARVLQPGDVRGHSRRRGIEPARLHQVRPVQPAGMHPNPDLLSPRLGGRNVADLEDL